MSLAVFTTLLTSLFVTLASLSSQFSESLDSDLLALFPLRNDYVLLFRCVERRMVAVGGISILEPLQNTNDLTAACLISYHFQNSKPTRPEPKDDSPALV